MQVIFVFFAAIELNSAGGDKKQLINKIDIFSL